MRQRMSFCSTNIQDNEAFIPLLEFQTQPWPTKEPCRNVTEKRKDNAITHKTKNKKDQTCGDIQTPAKLT